MTLSHYICLKALSAEAAGRELGVSGQAVRHWCRGARIPRRDAMARIQAWSDGEVTPADFFIEPPKS